MALGFVSNFTFLCKPKLMAKLSTLKNPDWLVVLLFLVVWMSRLPFLFEGYGSEEDSWGTPLAIWQTLKTGIYEPSRLPGHPIQEIFYLLTSTLPPFWWNCFSALACAFSSIALFYIFLNLELQRPFLSALSLSFVPVIYISSTYTIDYCFTLCFLLWSFFYFIENKYWISGLFLGLAIGCRITTGIFILPFGLWLLMCNRKEFTSFNLLRFGMMSAMVGTISYLPLFYTYGLQFFQYYDQFPYPSIEKIFYKASFGVWGTIGLIGLVSACIFQIIRFGFAGIKAYSSRSKCLIGLALLIVVLFTFSYLRLPQKSGYWVPVIPFIFLAFAAGLEAKSYQYLMGCFLISSFFCSIGLTDSWRGSTYSKWSKIIKIKDQELFLDPFTGPIFSDLSKRENKEYFCKKVSEELSEEKHSNSILICGWWYNELMVNAHQKKPDLIPHLKFYSNQKELETLVSKKKKIYFLPEQDKYNDLYSGITATSKYASPWMKEAYHER